MLVLQSIQEDKLTKKLVSSGEDYENELRSRVSAFEALERDFQEVTTTSDMSSFAHLWVINHHYSLLLYS